VIHESYDYCSRLTRLRAKNFYYAFRFLPAWRRRSIFAVYSFSRRLDDIVDGDVSEHDPAGNGRTLSSREHLQYMRALLDPHHPSEDPLALAIRHTIHRFRIPLEHFDELIAGMTMDLEGQGYRTFEDLRLYCYRAASTIGLICIEIFGHDGTPADVVRGPAVDLGLAMQLTNILRDITEDLNRDRVYLPADELDRFGVSVDTLRRGEPNDAFRALMEFQVNRARRYFRSAELLFPMLNRRSRPCPVVLKALYSEILRKIVTSGYDVLRQRPSLSRIKKLRLVGGVWLRTRLGM